MARGNQRDKARVSHAAQKIFESEVHVEQEKNQKDQAAKKSKNTQSGTEFQRTKEQQAAIMRQKQAEAFAKKESAAAGNGKK